MFHLVFGTFTILSAILIAAAGLLISKFDKKPTYRGVLDLLDKEQRKYDTKIIPDLDITVVPYGDNGLIDKTRGTKNVLWEIRFRRKWPYIVLGIGFCFLILSLLVE